MEDIAEKHELVIDQEIKSKYKRLDALLRDQFPQYSRTYLKNLFLEGYIDADVSLSMSKVPPIGTEIEMIIPLPEDASIEAEDIPLEILYEDEYLVVIKKPAGLVVHPAPGHPKGTLVNALMFHCKDLKGIGNIKRPGIVHRLDKGTSGVMVAAKEQKTHEKLVDLFKTHDIQRQYVAIALGSPQRKSGTLESLIARSKNHRKKMTTKTNLGKTAITHYQVLEDFEKASLIQLTLETGRTHQIRVHLNELLQTPVFNDPTYGRPNQHIQRVPELAALLEDYEHPLLHAKLLGFKHPKTGKELLFETNPPQVFQNCLEELKSHYGTLS